VARHRGARRDVVSGQAARRHPEARTVPANVADGTITVHDLLEARTLAARYPRLPKSAAESKASGANLIPLDESLDVATSAGLIGA
jgi:hypothetical protein